MRMFQWKVPIKACITILLFGLLLGFLGNGEEAAAAAKVAVTEIDYNANTITLKANSGDKRIYFSDSKKKKWLVVPGEMDASKLITFDISWVTQTKDYIITFRGDVSTEEIAVTIPKTVPKFKVIYNMSTSKIEFQNLPTGRTVEWRKSGSILWNSVATTTDMEKQIQAFYDNGATLYFRVAGINGTSVDATGGRISKEVALRIAKRTAAPTIVLDGSSFNFLLKSGMAYKKAGEADWTTITTSEKKVALKDVLPQVLLNDDGTGTSQDAVLEFRRNASSSSQESQVTSFKVLAQRAAPSGGTRLEYTSKTGCSLYVADAAIENPYEYTIVGSGATLNLDTAIWNTIRSDAAVNFQDTEAPGGSTIYLRKKSMGSTATGFVIASAPVKIEIVAASFLGSNPAITETKITRPHGSISNVTFQINSPVATQISRVLIAGKEIDCTSTTGTSITVTLPAASMWEKLAGYTEGGELSVKAVLKNGEVLTTLVLEVLPASKILDGTDSSFQSLHGANTITASVSLKFGSKYEGAFPTVTAVKCSGQSVTISSTTYDTDLGTGTVELNLAGLSVNPSIKYGITITLSSGEQLKDIANITFHPIASLGTEETTLSFNQGSFETDLEVEMLLNEAVVAEQVTGISWNSINLPIQKISQVGRRVKVVVSKDAVNRLTVSATTLKPVIITFDNGSKVEKGFNIRIMKSSGGTGISWTREEAAPPPAEDIQTTLLSSGSSALSPQVRAAAPSAAGDPNPGAVYVEEIDYDKLFVQINKNVSQEVFFSTDKKNWYPVEDPNTPASAATCDFDISWVLSTRATTIYFRGDADLTELSVTLPAYNAKFGARFDKTMGDIKFTGTDGITSFQWRKSSEYSWQTVDMDVTSQSYKDFLVDLDNLRTKGSKIIIRTHPVSGITEADGTLFPGVRPSKEVSVSISKRSSAPSAKLNPQKGTINTSTKMEYLDNLGWVDCTKTMTVQEIAPGSLTTGSTPGTDTIIHIRKKAYGRTSYSLETAIFVPGQGMEPTMGTGDGNDVVYRYDEDELCLSFTKASKAVPYEYAIDTSGAGITSKTRWKAVTRSDRSARISSRKAPNGSVIYVRKKGIKEKVSKEIKAELFSPEVSLVVTFQ